MGSYLDSAFRQPSIPDGKLKPSGSFPLTQPATATLLEQTGPGEWGYGREVAIEVTLNDLEETDLPDQPNKLFWSGIQVRLEASEAAKLPQFEPGKYHLITALSPASYFWFDSAPMRPATATVRPAIRREQLNLLAAGKIKFPQLLFDPFEKDPGWHTARLGDPVRPHWQQTPHQDKREGFFLDRNPNRQSAAPRRWFFALSPVPPGQILMALMQQMNDFKEDVLSGAYNIAPRQKQSKSKSPQASELDNPNQSLANLWPGENFEIMLDASVRQALAGRDQGSQKSLDHIARNVFIEHFRNAEQRLLKRSLGIALTRATAEKYYKAFREQCPKCDLFRRKDRLQIPLLCSKSEDPSTEKCRLLFGEFLRRAKIKTR
jgi:hypothetical protein